MALGVFLGLPGLIICLFLSPSHEVQVQREAQRMRIRGEAGRYLASGQLPPAPRTRQRWTTDEVEEHYARQCDVLGLAPLAGPPAAPVNATAKEGS